MNPKVLLVDDNITVIRILTSILEAEGFTVYSTTDSTVTQRLVQDTQPDVIILDIVMPVLDGFTLCKQLKQEESSKDIPIIILTAENHSQDLHRAMEYGAMDYIRKPADKIEVIARVHSAYRIKHYQDQLKDIAMKDGLTGLYNHANLFQLFEKKFHEQKQKHAPISFIMTDIDFFKKINDTYGHVAGDAILKEVACILSWSVGTQGIVGRYGGEEFGIILPAISLSAVLDLCEQIRGSIEGYDFLSGQTYIKATISIGICFHPTTDGISYEKMIKTADTALYEAKRSGRNRVEVKNLG